MEKVLRSTAVSAETGSALNVRVVSIGELLLTAAESSGSVIVVDRERGSWIEGYARLTFTFNGCLSGLSASGGIADPGTMALTRWRGPSQFQGDRVKGMAIYIPEHYFMNSNNMALFSSDATLSCTSGFGSMLSAMFGSFLDIDGPKIDENAVQRMLPHIAEIIAQGFFSQTPRIGFVASSRYNKVCEYLEAHFADCDLSPKRASRECGISERQIFREFARMDDSFGKRLKIIRLARAASRIDEERDAQITCIAYDCGFSSSQHFSSSFREHFGVSPNKYRQSRIQSSANLPGRRGSL